MPAALLLAKIEAKTTRWEHYLVTCTAQRLIPAFTVFVLRFEH